MGIIMDNYQENTPIVEPGMAPVQNNIPPPQELPPSKKNNKLIILAVILVLVLLAGAGAYKLMHTSVKAKVTDIKDSDTSQSEGEADNDNFKYEATVKITSDGFSPASLEVKPDTRVLFENSDSIAHHILLTQGGDNEANFDSKEAILPGSGYGHSFEKAGTFQYHDADKPEIGGVITVK